MGSLLPLEQGDIGNYVSKKWTEERGHRWNEMYFKHLLFNEDIDKLLTF